MWHQWVTCSTTRVMVHHTPVHACLLSVCCCCCCYCAGADYSVACGPTHYDYGRGHLDGHIGACRARLLGAGAAEPIRCVCSRTVALPSAHVHPTRLNCMCMHTTHVEGSDSPRGTRPSACCSTVRCCSKRRTPSLHVYPEYTRHAPTRTRCRAAHGTIANAAESGDLVQLLTSGVRAASDELGRADARRAQGHLSTATHCVVPAIRSTHPHAAYTLLTTPTYPSSTTGGECKGLRPLGALAVDLGGQPGSGAGEWWYRSAGPLSLRCEACDSGAGRSRSH